MYELPGDIDPEGAPGGVRFGTHAITSRGATEEHFREVAQIINCAVIMARRVGKDGLGEREVRELEAMVCDVAVQLAEPGSWSDI